MCKKQHITQKITELEYIKSAYTRYIIQYTIANDVENATKIRLQKKHIKYLLRNLYAKLYQKQPIMENSNQKVEKVTVRKISDEENSAIFNFNNDKRFTITE
ncbi:hypothetical protein [Flavobacterium litorale]|uniref:Phage integrase SAM-like domain-containing protein n=1 Tax=Flavobacterium litorale TaxID=2856519 RepID=A0ABX8VCK0_9FLAO|nr:hypothetical protein [Flavobacterium litorale]QYJ68908.1 hypothetical protein K1I41_03220 [Flavobacterium litorale]